VGAGYWVLGAGFAGRSLDEGLVLVVLSFVLFPLFIHITFILF